MNNHERHNRVIHLANTEAPQELAQRVVALEAKVEKAEALADRHDTVSRAMCEAFQRLEEIVGIETGGWNGPGPALSAVEQIARRLSFERMRQANVARQQEWPGYEQTDTTFKALEVCGEAGELAEAVKKLVRAERGIAGSTAGLESVTDELGDVIISADLLAAHLGIDLAEAVARKFNKTSTKYGLETRLGMNGEEAIA